MGAAAVGSLDAVRDLLGRYCELVDAADWAGVGELFADGCLSDEDGNVFARGAPDVAAYFRDHILLYDGSPRTKHLVLNSIVEDEGDELVVMRSSYLVLQAVEDQPLHPIVTGRYRDTFKRNDDGAWRFQERRYAIDLAGDLSRHLR